MSIVEELRAAIQASGMSLNQIEDEAGIGNGILSRFVNGQRDLAFESAAKVAKFFNLHLSTSEGNVSDANRRLAALRAEAETARSLLLQAQESLGVLIRAASDGPQAPASSDGIVRLKPRKRGRPPGTESPPDRERA